MGVINSSQNDHAKKLLSHHLTKAYFKKIKQLHYIRYHKNRYSKNNIRKCYEKDTNSIFSLINSNKQIRHYIPWYYYLYNSLIEKEKERKEWAVTLVDELEQKVFFEESAHLSEFFYEEFAIKYQPSSLKTIMKEQNEPIDQAIITYGTSNSYGFSHNRSQSILNTTKHYGGSFMSIDIDNINYQDPTQLYKLSRKQVKEYTHVFKEKLSKQSHPINMAISSFVRIFSKFILDQINKFKLNKPRQDDVDNFCLEVSENIRWFVKKIQITIKWFYCRTIDLDFFNKEKDDMFNLVMSLIFSIGDLHSLIYELYKIKYESAIKDLERKLKECENISTDDLGIVEQFCLNDVTRNKFNFSVRTDVNEPNPYTGDNKNAIIEQINEEDENTTQTEIQSKPKRLGFSRNTPYSKVIQEIKRIARFKQPIEKVIITTRLTQMVEESINEFWKNEAVKYNKQFLEVNTDELISIMVYVIIKAQIPEILIHVAIIENYTPDATQSSEIGFRYTALLGAVSYLEHEIKGVKDLVEKGRLKKMKN